MSDRLDLPSRVLAVADVYDALTRDRPYREARPREKAPSLIRPSAGPKNLRPALHGDLVGGHLRMPAQHIIGSESGEKLCPTSEAALGELAGEDVR